MKRIRKTLEWEKLFPLIEAELRFNPSIATIESVIREWGSPEQLDTWGDERIIDGEVKREGHLIDYACDCRAKLLISMSKAQRTALLGGRGDDLMKVVTMQNEANAANGMYTLTMKPALNIPRIVPGKPKEIVEDTTSKKEN